MTGANAVLTSAPGDLASVLAPHLTAMELMAGDDVARHDLVMFPTSAVIALEIPAAGTPIITGVIGPSGVHNLLSAFGVPQHGDAVVLIGGRALAIPAASLSELVAKQPKLLEHLLTFHNSLLGEFQQLAACNAVHDIAGRTCRWLCRVSEEVGDRLPLKQTDLARMLGVQRTSISQFAATLQERGIIEVRRGNIQIKDIDRLRHMACECLTARTPIQQAERPVFVASAF